MGRRARAVFRSHRLSAGVTLLETLVALAVIALGLTLAVPLLALEWRLDRRLEARREVRAMLEVAEQMVRVSGDPEDARAVVLRREHLVAEDLSIAARLTPEALAGLSRLEISASWRVGPTSDRLELVTLVWREP